MLISLLLAAPLSSAQAAPVVEVARDHLAPPAEVALEGRTLRWAGGHLVRMQQRLHGLPVQGRPVVLSVDDARQVRRLRGGALRGVRPQAAALTEADAQARASELAARLGTGELWPPRAELAWLVEGEGAPRLTWAVDLSTASPVATWRTWLDAQTGEIVRTDLTSRTARANVFPMSPANSDLEQVVLQGLPEGAETLSGELVSAASCDDWLIDLGWFGVTACFASSPHALADDAGDFLFAPDPPGIDDPQAEVQVYYHVDRVACWLQDRYGFRHTRPMQALVNFPMTNAFFGDFDGDRVGDLAFGHDEETGVDFAYDADVVYHEFGHSVVSVLAELPFLRADRYGMDWVAGSVNEGYADILAMALTGDPFTGEYAGSALGREAVRVLEEDRRCPDDLQGEVHADGEILGALAWNLMERIGEEPTHDVFFGALPFWGPDVSWPSVGASLLDSASELLEAGEIDAAAHSAVVEEVERANLLDCGRVLPLDSGEPTVQYMIHVGLKGDLERIPFGMQFSVDVPDDASAVRLDLSDFRGHPGLGWTVFGRAGEYVEHEVVAVPSVGLAVSRPVLYDFQVDGAGEGTIEVTLDSDPPLVPGQTLYFALSSRNLGSIDLFDYQLGRVTLSASVERSGGQEIEEGELTGGCSCRHTPVGAGWGLLVGALALLRRRRGR